MKDFMGASRGSGYMPSPLPWLTEATPTSGQSGTSALAAQERRVVTVSPGGSGLVTASSGTAARGVSTGSPAPGSPAFPLRAALPADVSAEEDVMEQEHMPDRDAIADAETLTVVALELDDAPTIQALADAAWFGWRAGKRGQRLDAEAAAHYAFAFVPALRDEEE